MPTVINKLVSVVFITDSSGSELSTRKLGNDIEEFRCVIIGDNLVSNSDPLSNGLYSYAEERKMRERESSNINSMIYTCSYCQVNVSFW